ncbi:uncharacterized protein FA14DRAFT_160063 [Meira miltonrushii]|uniref:Uncharacterized protein n=1 Tax=Meira miltonrushii TaxID=1280837 RepID=A0A316VNG4_9BASI|nr:uncharacterized protein FA14DRAFT_160063 [Meira miltonrushii]PWN38608.1 hypothetical protein FA14DRAFT_160063 [Meira miltonrushii]
MVAALQELKGTVLQYRHDTERVWVQPWGPNALRVRAMRDAFITLDQDWALSQPVKPTTEATVTIKDQENASLHNGKIMVQIVKGKMTFFNTETNKPLLEEYVRNRFDPVDPNASALELDARTFISVRGTNNYKIIARFESLDPEERIYGMGQYQQPYLNIKGADIELAHRNSQASIPFATSSLGYGFLWNNPAIGRAVFGKNLTSFKATSSLALDYWIVAGDTPAEIQERYAAVTGYVPMMPEYGLGFWQCKLRYQTQEELLQVAREYRKRDLPLDLIVIDFFHWALQGDWKFDKTFWPDPVAMMAELKQLGVELMVSIWPTVDKRSENYEQLRADGHLVKTERGSQTQLDFQGECNFADFSNPEARKAVWQIAKRNYFELGIKTFWLDEAEPEFTGYDYDHYRMHAGSFLQAGNIYPKCYAEAFYEGQEEAGQKNIVNLLRCAWAGSQKYGALVWSGDIASSWKSYRNQLAAGLNMGLSGIPWWTTDIGGFHGGDPNDEAFRELFVRWFQWGTFCPVMRLHGDREPKQPQLGTTGGSGCLSGADNEVWSYGETVYKICETYMYIREDLRNYTRSLMEEAHQKGSPVIRTMFYTFPKDDEAWKVEDQYMYGDRYLVAPVLQPGQRQRKVYFPKGTIWQQFKASTTPRKAKSITASENTSGSSIQGGQTITVDAPLEEMPVFVRVG